MKLAKLLDFIYEMFKHMEIMRRLSFLFVFFFHMIDEAAAFKAFDKLLHYKLITLLEFS